MFVCSIFLLYMNMLKSASNIISFNMDVKIAKLTEAVQRDLGLHLVCKHLRKNPIH